MNLEQALRGCSTSTLRKMAERRGQAADVTSTRIELVEILAAHLREASYDGRLWSDLSRHEQAALELVADSGGLHGASLLERRLRARFDWRDDEAARLLVGRLVELGILFKVFGVAETVDGPAYVLPDEYRATAPREPRSKQATDPVPPPSALAIRRNDVARDLFLLASALRRQAWSAPLRPIRGRGPRPTSAVLGALRGDVDGPLEEDWSRRWRFLSRLGVYMRWLGEGPLPVPDDHLVDLMLTEGSRDLPPRLWRAYGSMSTPLDRGDLPATARRDLVQLLATLPRGQWLRLTELRQRIGSELGPLSEQALGIGGTLSAWLAGPPFWLGVLAWARDASGSSLVQVSCQLRMEAGCVTAPVDGGSGRSSACDLSDDLTMVARRGADLAAVYQVEPYLEYVGGVADRRYRLTASSLGRGLRLGGSREQAELALEQVNGGPLPGAWVEALDVTSGAMELQIEAAVVLRATTGEAMRRALDVSNVREAVGERLSDRAVLIDATGLGSVLEGLATAGQRVELGAGLKLEFRDPVRAAGVGGGAAEVLWLVLRALESVDASLLDSVPNARGVRASLDFVLPSDLRRRLERRAAAFADRLRSPNRASPRTRRRPMA